MLPGLALIRQAVAGPNWHSVSPVCIVPHTHDGFHAHRRPGAAPGRDPQGLPGLFRPLLARGGCQRRVSGGVRTEAHGAGLAGGADPRGVRRHRPGDHRGEHHPGGDQPLGRQRHGVSCADVHHGHAPAARQRGAEGALSARCGQRGDPAPGVRRHGARLRLRDHAHSHHRRTQGRPLRGQRAEDLHLPGVAVGPDAAPGPHHPLRRAYGQDPWVVGVSGGYERGGSRPWR